MGQIQTKAQPDDASAVAAAVSGGALSPPSASDNKEIPPFFTFVATLDVDSEDGIVDNFVKSLVLHPDLHKKLEIYDSSALSILRNITAPDSPFPKYVVEQFIKGCRLYPIEAMTEGRHGHLIERDDCSRTPLHYACSAGVGPDVIRPLLSLNLPFLKAGGLDSTVDDDETESAMDIMSDEDGLHPLALAVSAEDPDEGSIALLIEAFPSLASQKCDWEESTVLHDAAASSNCSMSIVERIIQAAPENISHPNCLGQLPLHMVCSDKTASIEKIYAILKPHPKGVRHSSRSGRTPLHSLWDSYATSVVHDEGKSVELFAKTNMLLQLSMPRNSQRINNGGTASSITALLRLGHLAPWGLLELYLTKHFGSPHGVDTNGCTMLHFAASSCFRKNAYPRGEILVTNVSAVEKTLRSSPGASRILARGSLPLHYLASRPTARKPKDCDDSVDFRALLAAHPLGATQPDGRGRLPLHLAAAAKRRWKSGGAMPLLLRSYPAALSTVDPVTGLSVFSLAAVGRGADLNTVFLLLRADPSQISNATLKRKASAQLKRKTDFLTEALLQQQSEAKRFCSNGGWV